MQTGRKLVRKRRGITGISAGIADYFNVSPALVRVTFIVGAAFSSGLALLVYAALFFIMPKEKEDDFGEDGRFGNFEEISLRRFESGISIRPGSPRVTTNISLEVCSKCDTVSKPGSTYCHKCGNALGGSDEA